MLHRLRGKDNYSINSELNELRKEAVRRAKLRSLRSVFMDQRYFRAILGFAVSYSLQFVLWRISALGFYSSHSMFQQNVDNAVEKRREALLCGGALFGMNVFYILILHAHRFIRISGLIIGTIWLLLIFTLMQPGINSWFSDSCVLGFPVVLVNMIPMVLTLFENIAECRVLEFPPCLILITTVFFNFCIGMSFVSMHSFFGGDGLWLWTIYFFGYFAVYYTSVFLRQRRYFLKEREQNQTFNFTCLYHSRSNRFHFEK